MRKPVTVVSLVVVAIILAVMPVGAVTGWTGPTRIVPENFAGTPSLVLHRGVLHVAYFHQQPVGGDEANGVFYASNAGGTWRKQRLTTESVDNSYARPSLAVDAAGKVHIAFTRPCFECSPFESNIWIASNATGSWVVDQLTNGREDLFPSLAATPTGLAIAFNRVGRAIVYGSNASGRWTFLQAAALTGRCPALGIYPSIAVDGAGKPWIAYEHPRATTSGCQPPTAGIRVATLSGTTWTRTIISTDSDDLQPRVALDPNWRPHLVFGRSGTGTEYTRRLPDGSWTILVRAAVGEDATLAIDGAGNAHIAYEGSGPGYATNKSGAWVRKALATYSLDHYDDSPVCIALTNTGKARVIFARSESDGSEDSLGLYLAREL